MTRDWPWHLGLALGLLSLWELGARASESLLVPTATGTARALVALLASPALWQALRDSHASLAIGFAAAVAAGVPLGLLFGRWPRVALWCDPHLDILLVTPTAAIVPLLIMLAGLSVWARGLIVCAFALPVIIVTTEAGMREVDARLLEMARAFGATPSQVLWRVRLPAARPAVAHAMRLGLTRAFSGMIVSELVLTASGLGGLALHYQADFDGASMFAVAALVVAEAVALLAIATRVDRWAGGASAPATS